MRIKLKPTVSAPLLVLVMYILMTVSSTASIEKPAQRDNVFLAVIILQAVIFIIPGILYCKLRGDNMIASLNLRLFGPRKMWFSIFALFTMIFGSSLIKVALYSIGYYSTRYSLYDNYLPSDASSVANILYIIIAIAIIPAVTEEFIFRGIIFGEYRACGVKNSTALVISSLLFGMLHFNIYQLPVYFFGGLILAGVVMVTDSLPAAMIVHLLSNAFGLLFETQLLRLITQTDSMIFVVFVLTILFVIFLLLTLQNAEHIYYKKGINGYPSPKKRKKNASKGKMSLEQQAFLSPVFIACIVVFFITTFAIK